MSHLTSVLLVLLLTYQLATQVTISQNILSRAEEPSNCVDCRLRRTFVNILWGCISTTLICAWTTVHPNIPPRERPVKRILRRVELMFWAIVAPEILPAWALNQRAAAEIVIKTYNERNGVCVCVCCGPLLGEVLIGGAVQVRYQ